MQGLIVGVPIDAPLSPAWTALTCFRQSGATPQTGEKRGRGRPRKAPGTETPKPVSDGPKRGRGRPRKDATETKVATPSTATPSSAKKGRGRPRKEPGMEMSLICFRINILTLKFVSRLCYTCDSCDSSEQEEGWPRPRKTPQGCCAKWRSRSQVGDTGSRVEVP
jgi:hypothetical protein